MNLTREFEIFHKEGLSQYRDVKSKAQIFLDTYTLRDGTLDGTQMQGDWFPLIDADVFISHSHKNEDAAIELSGWLSKTFGLTSFIDSCVWGYGDDLLREIDKEHCKIEDSIYSYKKRNQSTSHVHMMLCTALSKMIDKAKCVFFLNTPDSISTIKAINNAGDDTATPSPWIYYEIAVTELIRKKIPKGYKPRVNESTMIEAQLDVLYRADLSHLYKLDKKKLIEWRDGFKKKEEAHPIADKLAHYLEGNPHPLSAKALCLLYDMTPLTA